MRRLDRWLGFLPDYVLTLLLKLLRSKPVAASPGRPIVLVKPFGAGSIVLIAQVLRRFEVDAAEVWLVTFKSNASAAALVGFEKIVPISNASPLTMAVDYLKALSLAVSLKPRAVVDFEFYSRTTSIFAKIVTLITGAKVIGFWDADFPRASGYHGHMPFSYATHITELYEAGFQASGLHRRVSPQEHGGRQTNQRRRVLVNPNASDLALGRKWPEANFVELIVRLTQRFPDVEIGLTGEPREAATSRRIRQNVLHAVPHARVEDYSGQWDFATFWDEVRSSLMLITNDSGPVHFASYLGVPSVSLWGPGSPHQFGPLDRVTHKTVWSAFPCSPCMYVRDREPGGFCGQTFPCMPAISVDTVFQACAEVIVREMDTSMAAVAGSR
jgi:ADP-heptose:LPS heptosyltransferase